ncbi:LuxR C-terminal-related transcriptional regulator [uncultured Brevundimonas sp.]|uniref:helix-turn-helix transcriptional regulator n=1 Tax=uncultured Brevundimonas sp. TaxID=213418 RepID=UPI0030EC7D5E|tara:strand:+ start:2395 stop:3474 length:1080 start_codon:yes stop_codon:yes gene_type:complete
MPTDLIDRIYECSVVPELWPTVLDDLANLTEARGGLLFSAHKALCWTASGSVRDVFDEYVNEGWFKRCSRRVCLMSQSEPSFFVEQDFWSEDQLGADPIYRDFFRPHGLGWSAGTGLRVPSGDNIVFSIERAFERGPIEIEHVERLNTLRPHLARSALVSSRLGLQRARGAAEALTDMGLPALLLDEDGRVVEANALMEAMPGRVGLGANDRLVLADRGAQARLTEAMSTITATAGVTPCTVPLRDEVGRATMVLHLMPVRRSAHDIFGRGYALLLITPVAADRAPSLELMRSLFDLTVSEARVARGLAIGKSLEMIATEGDVAITTVRSQLRRVLEKTGCTRQAEVAALLASVAVAPV